MVEKFAKQQVFLESIQTFAIVMKYLRKKWLKRVLNYILYWPVKLENIGDYNCNFRFKKIKKSF